jgi:hypothetical protein
MTNTLQNLITNILNPAYILVATAAFLYFLYGALMFIISLNDPDSKNTGKEHLLWGMVGLFIIFSVGGIFKYFDNLFGGLFK